MNTAELNQLFADKKYEELLLKINILLTNENLADEEKVTLYHLMGSAYYFSNQIVKSIDAFKKVLAINPKHTDSSISLSVIYNDIGKYDEARQIYKAANQALQLKRVGQDLDLDKQFSLKHIETGDMYFKFHRYDEALDDYLKASRLDSQNPSIRIKLAKVYAKKGFTTRALQELQQLCSEDPKNIEPYLQLGLMYFSLGNIIDAQITWEQAKNIDPDNSELKEYLSMSRTAKETRI